MLRSENLVASAITCVVLALFITGAPGCGKTEAPTADPAEPPEVVGPPPTQTEPETTTENSEPEPSAEVTLEEIDGDGLKAAIAAHKGSVILIDFWATWCAPCRERFPHIVELSETHADEGLVVISIAEELDPSDPETRPAVLSFLEEQGAEFENYISVYGLGAESAEAFDYGGDLPFYKLYDRAGNLRHQFSGDPRDDIEPVDDLDARVEELLAESA